MGDWVSLHHHTTSCQVTWKGIGRPPVPWCVRLDAKTERDENGCLIYLPCKDKADNERPGAMVFSAGKGIGPVALPRWLWIQENGSIETGLELDHVRCNNWRCVDLRHLEPVTPKVNGERYAPIRAQWTQRNDLGQFAGRQVI